jgi:hypothetical protein
MGIAGLTGKQGRLSSWVKLASEAIRIAVREGAPFSLILCAPWPDSALCVLFNSLVPPPCLGLHPTFNGPNQRAVFFILDSSSPSSPSSDKLQPASNSAPLWVTRQKRPLVSYASLPLFFTRPCSSIPPSSRLYPRVSVFPRTDSRSQARRKKPPVRPRRKPTSPVFILSIALDV